MRYPLGGSGGLPPLHVLVFADAGQRGHVENVSDAVLRLQGRTLQVGDTQLLGCVGALLKETSAGITVCHIHTLHFQIFCYVFILIIELTQLVD